MPAITIREIARAYDLGKLVFQKEATFEDAVDELENVWGMNRTSASDYIANVGNLLSGKVYKRTFNLTAAKYFLAKISTEFELPILQSAFLAVREHVSYYQSASSSNYLNEPLLNLVSEYEKDSNKAAQKYLKEVVDNFDEIISVPSEMSDSELQKRSSTRGKPTQIKVSTVVYVRNPFVREFVNRRAGGKCEFCKGDAPFFKNDNLPFLEVHHILPLAEDGDDTIANSMALCPNCHREAHYGKQRNKFRS